MGKHTIHSSQILLSEQLRGELLEEAGNRSYLNIAAGRIKYFCRRECEFDYNDPEEKVRAALYAWLILHKGYSSSQIDLEVTVPRRVPSDHADLVIYEDVACRTPYLVAEFKKPKQSAKDKAQGIEQVFGNANSLRVTRFALFDSLDDSCLFAVQNFPPGERSKNLLGNRDAVPEDFGRAPEFRLIAGTRTDIAPMPIRELESRVRRAHAFIWAGGKRDPLQAFDEWCKLLFAKIHDERNTPNGQPRLFQVGLNESAVRIGNRVRELYRAAIKADPTIFSRPIDLPDTRIEDVVRTVEDCGFTLTDLDTLGAAFEAFFGAIFRGDLGQYFTRREIARFTCALLQPNEEDIALDPTAGSGGFLLELLIQVWHRIDKNYAGRPDQHRLKLDFASKRLFGVEIHEVLGRVCQTNLLLHKDGHTNIEVDRSCLDTSFSNPHIKPRKFTLVVGNPPFGDAIRQSDPEKLGGSRLADFGLGDAEQVDSEIVILVRATQFLSPGGRLGMVIPDGILNNSGEQSRCPWLRRYLLRNGYILAVVSLPDHAFRKAGAQNKTSLVFWRRFTEAEQETFEGRVAERLEDHPPANRNRVEVLDNALAWALQMNPYHVFLAEAEQIGFTPAGAVLPKNDLYTALNRIPNDTNKKTILGQYVLFLNDPERYAGSNRPPCLAVHVHDLFMGHLSHRLDPKFHVFRHKMRKSPPNGMRRLQLRQLLEERQEPIIPNAHPDVEFKTVTLTQDGRLEPREPGGNNPPSFFGSYFRPDTKWYRIRSGDLLFSRIDIWKGNVCIVTKEFDGAIVTNEFPVYRVRTDQIHPYYLKLLLRTPYFREAIRSITTGHSNRRRTQEDDFLDLEVFLPEMKEQEQIATAVQAEENNRIRSEEKFMEVLNHAERQIMGETPAGKNADE